VLVTSVLESQLIPGVKQSPGFVKGMWFGDDNSGHGVVVFETREQAERAQQPINSVVMEGIKVVVSDVYEVHREA
jgi:hypothetical protein